MEENRQYNQGYKVQTVKLAKETLADAMMKIWSKDECNDTYGCIRMYQALILK